MPETTKNKALPIAISVRPSSLKMVTELAVKWGYSGYGKRSKVFKKALTDAYQREIKPHITQELTIDPTAAPRA